MQYYSLIYHDVRCHNHIAAYTACATAFYTANRSIPGMSTWCTTAVPNRPPPHDTKSESISPASKKGGDGLGNNADTDDDSDNVPDSEDPFPLVRDTTAPSIILASGSFQLWPPNHQYETITVRSFVLRATDGTDGQLDASDIVITRVSSDELEDAPGGGDGATLRDIVIAADGRSVQLRSERQGSGNGRVYTIDVQVTDRSGNRAVASFQVQVPKSQNGNAALADTPRYIVSRP